MSYWDPSRRPKGWEDAGTGSLLLPWITAGLVAGMAWLSCFLVLRGALPAWAGALIVLAAWGCHGLVEAWS
jgi:hypothetical protein